MERLILCRPFNAAFLAALLCVPALWAAQAQSRQQQAETLITRAMGAGDIEKAAPLLKQARALLPDKAPGAPLYAHFLLCEMERARGQSLVQSWQRSGSKDTQLRGRAAETLRQALRRFSAFQRRCDEEAERLEGTIRGKPSENSQWRLAVSLSSRANYTMGWAGYHLGLALPAGAERERVLRSAFNRFSGFTANGYSNNPIVADCFIAAALCQSELGEPFEVLTLLEPIRLDNAPSPGIYKRAVYLRLQALQAQASFLKAERLAKQYFDGRPADQKPDAMELNMALVWADALNHLIEVSENARFQKMFRSRLNRLVKLLDGQGEPWRGELGKILSTGKAGGATASLLRAKDLFAKQKYSDAIQAAATGLRESDEQDESTAMLRFIRASAAWNLKDYPLAFAAGRDFLKAHPQDDRAHGVLTRTLHAALRARGGGEAGVTAKAFAAFLAHALETWPDSLDAPDLRWQQFLLYLNAGKFEGAAAALAGFTPESPLYLRALYGKPLLAYRRLNGLLKDDASEPEARAAIQAIRESIAEFAAAARDGERLRDADLATATRDIALATAQTGLQLRPPLTKAALALLDAAAKLRLVDTPTTQETALRIRAVSLGGNAAEALRMIEASLASGKTDTHLASAYSAVADRLEGIRRELRRDGKKAEARELSGQLVRIYELLLRYVDPTDEGKRREIGVRHRLAQNLETLAEWQQAYKHYAWLAERVDAKHAGDVLRGQAVCADRLGKTAEALGLWRTLSKGLTKGTDAWYQARYQVIDCHIRTGDLAHARDLLTMHELQTQATASEAWKARFAGLAERLPAPSSTVPDADPEDDPPAQPEDAPPLQESENKDA